MREDAIALMAEYIYEWEMHRDGWKDVKNFSTLSEESRKDYLEIASSLVDIYEDVTEDSLDEELSWDWDIFEPEL